VWGQVGDYCSGTISLSDEAVSFLWAASAILTARNGQPPVLEPRCWVVHIRLATIYFTRKKMKRTLLAAAAVVASFAATTPAFADQALATAKNCMACHAIDKKVVGPAYKDVAKKYAGDSKAAAMLTTKVMKGGAGVWGPVPMPANVQVNEAEAHKLVAWVLAMK